MTASAKVGFAVGHASAQQVWHGWLSRPTWGCCSTPPRTRPSAAGSCSSTASSGRCAGVVRRGQPRGLGGSRRLRGGRLRAGTADCHDAGVLQLSPMARRVLTTASTRGRTAGCASPEEQSHMFDGQFRNQVDAAMKPIGRGFARAGITADMITGVGLVMSLAAAVAIGAGALNLGLLLLVLTGIPDLLDGAVAKASGQIQRARGVLRLGVRPGHRRHALRRPRLLLRGRGLFSVVGRAARGGVRHRLMGLLRPGQGRCTRVRRPRGTGRAGRAHHPAGRRDLLFGGVVLVAVLVAIVVLEPHHRLQRFVKVWRQATDATPALKDRRRRRTARSDRSAARTPRRASRASTDSVRGTSSALSRRSRLRTSIHGSTRQRPQGRFLRSCGHTGTRHRHRCAGGVGRHRRTLRR